MCQELAEELEAGNNAAKSVLEHMMRMGADEGAIPVRYHDDEKGRELSYMVCVMPREKYNEMEAAVKFYRAHRTTHNAPQGGRGRG